MRLAVIPQQHRDATFSGFMTQVDGAPTLQASWLLLHDLDHLGWSSYLGSCTRLHIIADTAAILITRDAAAELNARYRSHAACLEAVGKALARCSAVTHVTAAESAELPYDVTHPLLAALLDGSFRPQSLHLHTSFLSCLVVVQHQVTWRPALPAALQRLPGLTALSFTGEQEAHVHEVAALLTTLADLPALATLALPPLSEGHGWRVRGSSKFICCLLYTSPSPRD